MKYVKYLSTLLIVLTITGSQFVTTLASQFISLENASQMVTVPYRAFTLLIAVLIIILTYNNRIKLHKVNKVLFVYWCLLVLRFVYDIYFRSDVSVDAGRVNQLWLFFIGSTLIPMYAITKSYKYVNQKLLFNGTYLLAVITAFMIVNNVSGYLGSEELEEGRLESNVAMKSILTGYFGLLIIILSIYSFVKSKKRFIKLINVAIFLIGILLLFRSGSRGPLFAAFGITLFILISKRSSPAISIVTLLAFLFAFLYWDYIILFLSYFAPNLFARLFREEGLFADRIPIYTMALDSFMKNPLIGHDFAIYNRGVGGMSYAHNMFLDTLMQLGLIGVILISYIVISVFKLITNNLRKDTGMVWLNIFLLMKIFMLQLSSAFYLDSSVSLIILFLFQQQLISNKLNIHKTNS